jgi:hypothetical protein
VRRIESAKLHDPALKNGDELLERVGGAGTLDGQAVGIILATKPERFSHQMIRRKLHLIRASASSRIVVARSSSLSARACQGELTGAPQAETRT